LLQQPEINFQRLNPLHLAAESGNVHAVTALLDDNRTDINQVNGYKRTALHMAAKEGNPEVLKLLLKDIRAQVIDINAVDKQGRTAFHLAAETKVSEDCTEERFLRCLALLMDRSDLQVNRPDSFGRSAISRALRKSLSRRVQFILQHQGVHKLNLDYSLADEGQTVRESILEKFPEFKALLPEPLMEDIGSTDPRMQLLAALQRGLLEEFTHILQNNETLIAKHFEEPYHSTCLELACWIKGREQFAQIILALNSDPNVLNRVSKIPLLHTASERLNLPALYILLHTEGININIPGMNKGTVLHWLALNKFGGAEFCPLLDKCVSLLIKHQTDIDALDQRGDTALHVAVRWGNMNLVLNLLSCGASVKIWNKRNHTPLHVAALIGNKDAVLTLRKYGADIDAENGEGTPLYAAAHMGKKDMVLLLLKQGANFMYEIKGETCLQYIDPQILRNYFDDCIESSGKNSRSESYVLKFKYNFIPTVKEKSSISYADTEMYPIFKMGEMAETRSLLKHPLISSALFIKWRHASKVVYYDICLYSLFLLFLTFHVISIQDSPKEIDKQSFNTSIHLDNTTVAYLTASSRVRTAGTIFLWIFFFLIIVREGVQFILDKSEYLRNPRNLFDAISIASTFVYLVVPHFEMNHHAASIAILLAWIEFLLLIGRLPSVSVKLEMLKKVSLTFLTFGLCYFPLILAFALSFNVLFYRKHGIDQDAYATEGIWTEVMSNFLFVFRTFIMFTGELEAKELPFYKTPVTSHLIFLFFVLLITLTLLNLLNGLAVSDTHAIIENAETLSLRARAKLILQTETVVLRYQKYKWWRKIMRRFCFLFGDLPSKRLYVYPKKKCALFYLPDGEKQGTMDSAIARRATLIAKRNASQF
jgi:ankyrin repeat protein